MIMATRRTALRTRSRIRRILIRSWEYIPTVRVTFLVLRLLAGLCLAVVGIAPVSISNWWGLLLLVLAVAVLPIGVWVFITTAKGLPTAEA
jgi:hypothetical protein